LRRPLRVKVTEKVVGMFEHFTSFDISVGGMFLKSEQPYAVGTDLEVEFTLPTKESPINAEARVVRIVHPLDRSGHRPGMGIKFTKIDPEDHNIIEEFVSLPGVY